MAIWEVSGSFWRATEMAGGGNRSLSRLACLDSRVGFFRLWEQEGGLAWYDGLNHWAVGPSAVTLHPLALQILNILLLFDTVYIYLFGKSVARGVALPGERATLRPGTRHAAWPIGERASFHGLAMPWATFFSFFFLLWQFILFLFFQFFEVWVSLFQFFRCLLVSIKWVIIFFNVLYF